MNDHTRNVHKNKTIIKECPICHEKFKNLTNHIRVVHKEGNFKCELCDKVFKTSLLRKFHFENVHDRQFKCGSCDKLFNCKGALTQHNWKRHNEGSATHICHLCVKGFTTISHFNKHFKMVHGITGYDCTSCDMKFTRKQRLDIHMIEVHQNKTQENANSTVKTEIPMVLKGDAVSHEITPDEFDSNSCTEQENESEIDSTEPRELIDSDIENQNSTNNVQSIVIAFSKDVLDLYDSQPDPPLKQEIAKPEDREAHFKCNICGKTSDTILGLENHVNDFHLRNRKFLASCELCKEQYIVENDQDNHFSKCSKLININ